MDNEETTNTELLSSQNKEHCEDQQSSEPAQEIARDITFQRLELIRYDLCVWVLHALLLYSPSGTECDEARQPINGSSVRLACLDLCTGTHIKFIAGKKTEGSIAKRIYANTFKRHMLQEIAQLSGNFHAFVEYNTGKEPIS